MAKFCSNCGKELEENAELCLNCGKIVQNNNAPKNKPKKKGMPTWAVVLIVIAFTVIIPLTGLVCVGIVTYGILKDVDVRDDNYFDDIFEDEDRGTIGDTLETDYFRVTLKDAKIYDLIEGEDYTDTPDEGNEYLIFFVEVQNPNHFTMDINDYDFHGYSDNYYTINAHIVNDINGMKELSAVLSPGMRASGYIAFEVNKTWRNFELHLGDDDDFSEIVFQVQNKNLNSFGL